MQSLSPLTQSGPERARLLFVYGTDNPERFKRANGKFAFRGSSDFPRLLERREPYHRLQVTPNYFRQGRLPDLGDYDFILNLITQAEDNAKVLGNLRKLVRGFRGKVINRPEAVLATSRDKVSRRLAAITGMIAPKTIRVRNSRPDAIVEAIARAGLGFPIIVRKAGTHAGNVLGLFDSIDSLRAALVEGGEYFAIEFVDFRSPDGLFRKYRVFFVGGERIYRSVIIADQWNIHAKNRRFMLSRPELMEEDERMFAVTEGLFPDAVHETLAAIGERMPLDFFGLDFGLTDDHRLILFEANATMNFFTSYDDPRFDYLDRCIPAGQAAFRRLLGLEPLPASIDAMAAE